MHELSLCGAIADIVGKHVGTRRVETVQLRIGQLRQVVPDTLTYCWQVVVEQTPLEGSQLCIEQVAARLRCNECRLEYEMGHELSFNCRGCGSTAVSVVAGEELLVTSMEVAADEPTGDGPCDD